jgi:hypothetical protein
MIDRVVTFYLGYPIIVSFEKIEVRTPDGMFVSYAKSVPEARKIIKGYRKEERRLANQQSSSADG